MNFLTLFVRNLSRGPYTEPFPFGPPSPTPKRLRGRISFDATICEGCLLCEKLCPSGAIKFTRTPDGMTFDCWHSTCVFCGTCEFYCPTKAIHQTNDWHLAHFQGEKFALDGARADPEPGLRGMRRQGPRHRAQRRPRSSLRFRRKNSFSSGRAARNAATNSLKTGGRNHDPPARRFRRKARRRRPVRDRILLHGHAAWRGFRMVRPREQRGAGTCRQGAARARRAPVDGVRACSFLPRKRRRKKRRRKARMQRPSPRKRLRRPSAARPWTARPTRSTITSISAATR